MCGSATVKPDFENFVNYYSRHFLVMSSCTIKLEILLTIFSLSLIPVNSQYQCDKYCHKSCAKSSNADFGDCLDANINCSCGLHPHIKIVLGIFGAFIGIAIILCCCAALKRSIIKEIHQNNLGSNTNATSVEQTVHPTPCYLQSAHVNSNNPASSAQIYSSGGGFIPAVPTTYGYSNKAAPPSYGQAITTNDSKPYPSGS